MHEGVQRALSSPLSTSYNGSVSPPARANSAGAQRCHMPVAHKGLQGALAPIPSLICWAQIYLTCVPTY